MERTLASRIALIILAVGATAAFLMGQMDEGNFMILAGMAFGAFFNQK